MQAIGYQIPGPLTGTTPFLSFETPTPVPAGHDLLVRVKAVSVNPVDTKVRVRATPEPGVPKILGFDAAGIVTAVGPDVTGFRPGDEVFYAGAIDRPGSNAEYQLVDARIAGFKPKSLGFADAAALPLTAITAWELLFTRLGVPYGVKTGGGTLLVIAGAGGVGSILIQLARRLTGLTVIATASRPDTADWCRAQGAHHVIDHRQPLDAALAAIGIAAVDLVASLSATDQHLPAIVKAIAPQGKLALIDDPKGLDILPFKQKAVSVHWEFMFTRSLFHTADMAEQGQLLNEVAALVDAGVLRTTAHDHLGPLSPDSLFAAHRAQESGRAIGKSVLDGL